MADALDPEIRYLLGHRFRMIAAGVPLYDFEQLEASSPTMDAWMSNGMRLAAEHERRAQDAEAAGHALTAADGFVRASICYHFAQFLYYGDAELKRTARTRSADLFRRAAPRLDPPPRMVTISVDGAPLYGYLRRPRSVPEGAAVPCVLLVPGLEATKEELYTFTDVFLDRGIATFNLDGAGQGETWERLPLSAAAYPRGVSAIVDHLAGRGDIDMARLAVVGVSLGGLLAPLSAALEPRLRACVSICGQFDWSSRELAPMLLKGLGHITQSADEERTRAAALSLTMAPVADRLTVPTLVVHAGQDKISATEEAYRYQQACGANVAVHIFPEANHVCHNIGHIYRPFVADWVADAVR